MKIRYGKQEYELNVEVDGEGHQTLEVEINDTTTYVVELKYGPVCNDKKYKDIEWLAKQYLKNQRSMADIGRQCGVSPMTIYLWLEKFGIDRRSRGRRANE